MEVKEFAAFRCESCRAMKPHRGRSVPVVVQVAITVVDGEVVTNEELFCPDCVRRVLGEAA